MSLQVISQISAPLSNVQRAPIKISKTPVKTVGKISKDLEKMFGSREEHEQQSV